MWRSSQRGDAIALLVAELGGPVDADFPSVRGEGGNRRQLVDQARDLAWRDLDDAGSIAFHDDCSAWLACGGADFADLDARAETAQHVNETGARRVQADIVDLDPGAGKRGRGDHPECRGRKITRHGQRLRGGPLTASHGDPGAIGHDGDTEGGQRALAGAHGPRSPRFGPPYSSRAR